MGSDNSVAIRVIASAMVLIASIIGTKSRADHIRDLQQNAVEEKRASWGHWGTKPLEYTQWKSHSNRLIPIYTFGIGLSEFDGAQSVYRNARRLKGLYGRVPPGTLNRRANYLDQTDVYRLQKQALVAGKKHVIVIIFDGMDWQTTRAAAIYTIQQVTYDSGRGKGLYFQDYRGAETDFGFFVSSAHNSGTNVDVNSQTVENPGGETRGGYHAAIAGQTPWDQPRLGEYLLGKHREFPDVVTDSASSATSMNAGIKTFNGAINVAADGRQVVPLARRLQQQGFSIGVVTSVTISHATPAATYANNVSRSDYQDLTRDLLGLPSISHRNTPLPGVDVLLGGGWGETKEESESQGQNYVPGNQYISEEDLNAIDVKNGGRYRVVQRTPGKPGKDILLEAAKKARTERTRLFGFFGAEGGNLPYQTADGKFNPYEREYSEADVNENPTLADFTRAALGLLSSNQDGFWLMIEAGDVDWANHGNNIDDSIGATLSGDDAFRMVTKWVEQKSNWQETAVILTADHGHYLVLTDPWALIENR